MSFEGSTGHFLERSGRRRTGGSAVKRARLKPATQQNGGKRENNRPAGISSPDFLVGEILRGLYAGKYVPGQKLIEADLARDHRISRGSIREALRRLAAEGVISLTLHRGAYIRSLARAEVESILSVVEVLTGLAARIAASQVHLGDGKKLLRNNLAALVRAKNEKDQFGWIRARNTFHRTLAQIGGNMELDRALKNMNVYLIRVQFRGFSTALELRHLSDYRKITSAVLAGNQDAAETSARQHVRNVLESIRKLPDDAFSTLA